MWYRGDKCETDKLGQSHYSESDCFWGDEDGRPSDWEDHTCSYEEAALAKSGRCKCCEKFYLASPAAPVVTNEHGGRQSETGTRCDLLPPNALLHVAAILKHGAEKYGENNWHAIPVAEHVNHALTHLYHHLAGNTQDDHLGHAVCRLLMSLEQHLTGRPK